jgi:hypothetical protein
MNDDSGIRAIRGIVFGVLLSLPLWALIAVIVGWAVTR